MIEIILSFTLILASSTVSRIVIHSPSYTQSMKSIAHPVTPSRSLRSSLHYFQTQPTSLKNHERKCLSVVLFRDPNRLSVYFVIWQPCFCMKTLPKNVYRFWITENLKIDTPAMKFFWLCEWKTPCFPPFERFTFEIRKTTPTSPNWIWIFTLNQFNKQDKRLYIWKAPHQTERFYTMSKNSKCRKLNIHKTLGKHWRSPEGNQIISCILSFRDLSQYWTRMKKLFYVIIYLNFIFEENLRRRRRSRHRRPPPGPSDAENLCNYFISSKINICSLSILLLMFSKLKCILIRLWNFERFLINLHLMSFHQHNETIAMTDGNKTHIDLCATLCVSN